MLLTSIWVNTGSGRSSNPSTFFLLTTVAAVHRLARFSQKTELHYSALQQTITYDPSFSACFHLLIYFIPKSFAGEYIQNTVCFQLVWAVILTPHCSTSIDTYIAVTSSQHIEENSSEDGMTLWWIAWLGSFQRYFNCHFLFTRYN